MFSASRRTRGPVMAPRTNLAAVSILAAFVIGSVPAVLAQTTVEAETWDDAISKLECRDIKKNADGSFSVTGVITIKDEVQHNPIINVPRYTAQLEEKKSADRRAMR